MIVLRGGTPSEQPERGKYPILNAVYSYAPVRLAATAVCRRQVMRLAGRYADLRLSAVHIKKFAQKNHIALTRRYSSFNDFFSRERADVRFPAARGALGSPCQSYVTAWEGIRADRLVQAKGSYYRLDDLLSGVAPAKRFEGGVCVCCRLDTGHYHRVHFFDDGVIAAERPVAGRYDSVQPVALEKKRRLYAKNHRLVSLCRTEQFGTVAMVEVGALLVGSIVRTAPLGERIPRGTVKGHFKMGGSTVLLFFEKGRVRMDKDILRQTALGNEVAVDVGEQIGRKI